MSLRHMVRNWRVRSLSHSLHVKGWKSVIHLWVLSAVQLSCHSSQLSGSEFALCLTSMRRRGRGGGDGGRGDGGGERRVHGPILSSPFLLETRGWWESTGDLTSEAQTLPLHYSKAALLHLLSGEREPGMATPTHNSNTQEAGQEDWECHTQAGAAHVGRIWSGGRRITDADVGISQD